MPLDHLAKDAILKQIIASTPLPKVAFAYDEDPDKNPIYLALLESIVSQQISVKAADSIFTRFLALFPDGYPHPEQLVAKLPEELRSAGLSGQKSVYLQSVAEFALKNPMSSDHLGPLTDEEVVQYLLPIKGVGRWTVEMLLMFVLDRPDVFPVDDLVIRQKMVKAYGLTETGRALYKRLHEIAEPWRPHRTLASRYLWRWKAE
ncbi:DNA-3-methyladenine glycosylase family protein [Larkinella humicola]|uniref:DNA-3-methyladenine glycosylase II n=1 Tax=Larkinella humicola TaxID=2607654 RepID=A0A5N1JM07_9BACT|nr:DNA-3-methyladenine glycosylase [Larkinella humicola]KAA9357525.1 DNA-3-methyladenine glycosylase 2 family protein [Larkinella humicola]